MEKIDYKTDKRNLKSKQNVLKELYKVNRLSFKARAKNTIRNIGKGIVNGRKTAGKKTKNWFVNSGKRINLAGVNTKKNVKDFINTRQKYDELKKKYDYLLASVKVIEATGMVKGSPTMENKVIIEEISKILAVVE